MRTFKALVCGACFSGNMGGDALYQSLLGGLNELDDLFVVTFLSKYPNEEKVFCEKVNCKMISFSTIKQLCLNVPFFIFAGTAKILHLPYRWMAMGELQAYFENDVLVDCSGISFTDDRSLTNLIINTLWFLPAFVSGIPVIKISQSMGPFQRPIVKFFAKQVLNRIDVLISRGKQSQTYVQELLPSKEVYDFPDLAFCLRPASEEQTFAFLDKYGISKFSYNVMGPSFILDSLVQTQQYLIWMVEIAKRLFQLSNLPLVLIPHSRNHTATIGADSRDDMDICIKIKEKLDLHSVPCLIISDYLRANEFKSIIAMSNVAIGSRYHFLVAALSSGIPSLAIGWNHKYQEMLEMLNQAEFAVDYRTTSLSNLIELSDKLWKHKDKIRKSLLHLLPTIQRRSKLNYSYVLRTLNNQKGAASWKN